MARLAAVLATTLGLTACKSPMAKIDAVRDALVDDDSVAIANATNGYSPCSDAPR